MQFEDIIWLIGASGVSLTTIIQSLSKRYKPWSWLAQQFGKAINKDLFDKLDDLQNKVNRLEETDKKQNEERDEYNALEARRRILRFADECRRKEKHSEEYFNNILEDISEYKDYCDKHKSFENEKAVIAISIVEKAYRYCCENDDFL